MTLIGEVHLNVVETSRVDSGGEEHGLPYILLWTATRSSKCGAVNLGPESV